MKIKKSTKALAAAASLAMLSTCWPVRLRWLRFR